MSMDLKQHIIFFLFALLSSVFFSCNNPRQHLADKKFESFKDIISDTSVFVLEKGSPTIIKLAEFDKPTLIINTKDIIEYVRYVPLETNDDCLISSIEKIIIYQNYMYILDNFGKSVLVFDDQGKFISRIGREGKAPGEYINPINITIDENKQFLHVFDDRASKVLSYDLSGNYIKETKVGFRFTAFKILNDSTYIVNTDTRTNGHNDFIKNFKLLSVDNNWEITARGNLYDASSCSNISFSRDGLYKYGNELLYQPTFSYFVYTIDGKRMIPKYEFDVGNMRLPDFFECGITFDEFNKDFDGRKTKYAYIDQPIVESKDWLVTTFRYQARYAYLFYNKKDGAIHWNMMYDLTKLNEEFTSLAPMKGLTEEGEFFAFNDALNLKREADEFQQQTGKELTNINRIKVEDNPVMIFYKLK